MEGNLLLAIFVLLAATVLLVPLAKWAGLGTILGYLVAGVLIGPYGLQLVSDSEIVHAVAEFGVVMMLFLIGLEVDADELWRMRHQVLGLGLTQMVATSAILAGTFKLVGFSWAASVVVGLALAMSSTAIAMQSVAQRNITKTDTGRASLAVLLVQDVAVIPILAAIPLLAGMTGAAPVEALGEEVLEAVDNPFDWWVALGLVGAFVMALAGSRWVIRPFLMPWIARAKVPEAFTAFALALVIGAALVAESFHLSPALGAFLGGVLLADSEYRHELESNLEPFKGLLLGLFFISVGMSIDLGVLGERWGEILALVAALILLKGVVIWLLCRFFGLHDAAALRTSLLLTQGGEFSFVLFGAAASMGVMGAQLHTTALLVISLSMAATPFIVRLGDRMLSGTKGPEAVPDPVTPPSLRRHVVVAGYGRVGHAIAEMLEETGIPFVVLEQDLRRVPPGPRERRRVFYGDGSDPQVLRSVATDQASALVVTLDRPAATERVVAVARQLFPDLPIVARGHDGPNSARLRALGASVVVPETLELSLILSEAVLRRLQVPEDVVADAAELVRRYHSGEHG